MQSSLMLAAILLAAVAEGISVTMLLPIINIVIGQGPAGGQGMAPESSHSVNTLESRIYSILNDLGIEPSLGILLSVVTAGILIKSLLLLMARKHIGDTVAQFATNLRLSLLRSVLASRWDYFHHQPVGRLANAMGSETLRASQAYLYGTMMVAMALQALIYLLIGYLVHWQATLIALFAGIVIVLILNFLVSLSQQLGSRQTLLFRSLVSRLTDTLQSVRSLKAMAREDLAESVMIAETNELNDTLRKAAFSNAALNSFQEPLFTVVIVIGIFFALEYWGMPLVTVTVLTVILGRIMRQMGKIQGYYQSMVVSESAYWSLKQTIDMAENARENLSGEIQARLKHSIRFVDVSYAFDGDPVLNNITLSIPIGSLTTFIGPSGSGKTTILDLILGLYRPDSGQIFIDEVVLENIDLHDWRRQIGYVPQEQILLHDSVLSNVTLNDPLLNDTDAENALRLAGAWEFVRCMPDGMHTSVGERGTRLSGGQRQRILIARALVYMPTLLILDEPTSALDPKSEQEICETLYSLRGRYTILAVSHQTSLVEAADQVYQINNGRVVHLATPAMRSSIKARSESTNN